MNEVLLTVPEVAERLRLSVDTIYRHIKTGKLAAFKPGKSYLIDEAELEAYLTRNRTGGAS